MNEPSKGGIAAFVADRWVSWLIELAVLGVIAYFTIAETRKTAEQTREMITKYDKAISLYASQKTEAIDATVSSAIDTTKKKVSSITTDDVKGFIDKLKAPEAEE